MLFKKSFSTVSPDVIFEKMTIKDGNLNTLKCQIWRKKTPPKFCKLTPLSVKFEKKCCDATTVVRLKVWSRYFT